MAQTVNRGDLPFPHPDRQTTTRGKRVELGAREREPWSFTTLLLSQSCPEGLALGFFTRRRQACWHLYLTVRLFEKASRAASGEQRAYGGLDPAPEGSAPQEFPESDVIKVRQDTVGIMIYTLPLLNTDSKHSEQQPKNIGGILRSSSTS